MCGIAGIIQYPGEGRDALHRVAAMLSAMAHRGPDGEGTVAFTGGAAGAVRLALVDTSPAGLQPIWSPDQRAAILFNGEMYNFRSERAGLEGRGYRFRTHTDSEVLLALYLEHGLEFVHRLRGMFAFAILDWREAAPGGPPTVVLGRDGFGMKPLYIAEPRGPEGPILFASEVRALLASALVPRRLDREGLADYLTLGFLLQPRTILEGVRALRAGHLEVFRPGRPLERRQFWRLPESAPRRETLAQAASRLRGLIEESVALHSFADAPVGAFLSGGVDSSVIVALMSAQVPHLRTYTLSFPDAPGDDESDLAAATAARLGCHHTAVPVTGEDVRDALSGFAGQLDQPSADGLNTWLISRAAARDVKGVLSGLGADEWFSGYPVAHRMQRLHAGPGRRAWAAAGHTAHALARLLPAGATPRRLRGLAARRTTLATWFAAHSVFVSPIARALVGLPVGPSEEARWQEIADSTLAGWSDESPVGLAGALDAGVYMGSQLLRDSDATSMAHSLELRLPFVDQRIAEFSRSCADQYKLPAGESGRGAKRVLFEAVADLLPDGPSRPKRSFALPIELWMRGALAPTVEDTCWGRAVAERGLIDPTLSRRYFGPPNGRPVASPYPQLWSLMILELWCREVLDAPHPKPASGPPPIAATEAPAVTSAPGGAGPVSDP